MTSSPIIIERKGGALEQCREEEKVYHLNVGDSFSVFYQYFWFVLDVEKKQGVDIGEPPTHTDDALDDPPFIVEDVDVDVDESTREDSRLNQEDEGGAERGKSFVLLDDEDDYAQFDEGIAEWLQSLPPDVRKEEIRQLKKQNEAEYQKATTTKTQTKPIRKDEREVRESPVKRKQTQSKTKSNKKQKTGSQEDEDFVIGRVESCKKPTTR